MPLEVVIAGAGISGLCTAVALHQNGHSVKVCEFKDGLHAVGSMNSKSLALHWT